MKTNKSVVKRNILAVFIFLIGIGIATFPIVSQIYYEYKSEGNIKVFDHDRQKLDSEEINRRIKLAEGYNQTLKPKEIGDPFTEEEKQGVAEYARMLEINEQIGYIKIPKIKEELPIYAGTSEEVLKKGIGHLEGTSLPIGGMSTHSVLTGHRGLSTAKLFTDLDKLEIGDKFYIQNIQKSLAYSVVQIKVVEPTEFNELIIKDEGDYVTLLTCTPYLLNTQRLLIKGERVANIEEIKDQDNKNSIFLKIGKEYLVVLGIIVIGATGRMIVKYHQKRKKGECLSEK